MTRPVIYIPRLTLAALTTDPTTFSHQKSEQQESNRQRLLTLKAMPTQIAERLPHLFESRSEK